VTELALKTVELDVYDTASPAFRERLRRDAEIARRRAASAEEREVLDWCEAAAAEVWAEIDAAEERARGRS
jgi:hypothetical protein